MDETFMGPVGKIIGVVLAIVVLTIFGGLAILSAGTSTGITSAVDMIVSFLSIIGLVAAIGIIGSFLKMK